jgi:broad specificity phosphatase PhoE
LLLQGSTEDLTSTADKEKVSETWERAGQAWQKVLEILGKSEAEGDKVAAVVGHELTHVAMICHCLGLTSDYLDKFHLQTGSVSVVDFPDGPSGRGVVRCLNYTAHLGRWSIPVTRPSYTDEEY